MFNFIRAYINIHLLVLLILCLFGSKVATASGFESINTAELEKLITDSGKDKVVVVTFFASWCPPCKEELPMLVRMRNSFSEDELLIVGISVDENTSALKRFLNSHKTNFKVYLASNDIIGTYRVSAIPHMVIFDRKGIIVKNFQGLLPEEKLLALVKKYLNK